MSAPDSARIIAALAELIDALDRRVRHVERLGEAHIAGEATMLRNQALARIEELKCAAPDHRIPDPARPLTGSDRTGSIEG